MYAYHQEEGFESQVKQLTRWTPMIDALEIFNTFAAAWATIGPCSVDDVCSVVDCKVCLSIAFCCQLQGLSKYRYFGLQYTKVCRITTVRTDNTI